MFLDSTADLTMDYIILIVVFIDTQLGLMGWSSSREMPIPWQQESDERLLRTRSFRSWPPKYLGKWNEN